MRRDLFWKWLVVILIGVIVVLIGMVMSFSQGIQPSIGTPTVDPTYIYTLF